MQRRVSDPWMESLRAGLSCSRSPFLNQWMVLTTMSPAFCTYLYYKAPDDPRRPPVLSGEKKDPLYPIDSRYPCSMNVTTEVRLRSRDGCMCGGWATAAERGNNNTLVILEPAPTCLVCPQHKVGVKTTVRANQAARRSKGASISGLFPRKVTLVLALSVWKLICRSGGWTVQT